MPDEREKTAAEPAEKPKVNGAASSIVIKLTKSVIANGDEVMELSFREPTGADIERCGNPVLVDWIPNERPKYTFDSKSMTQMLAALAVVPPSTIRQMHSRDWNTAAWSLAHFFMPD